MDRDRLHLEHHRRRAAVPTDDTAKSCAVDTKSTSAVICPRPQVYAKAPKWSAPNVDTNSTRPI
jgi:hypothetical protein